MQNLTNIGSTIKMSVKSAFSSIITISKKIKNGFFLFRQTIKSIPNLMNPLRIFADYLSTILKIISRFSIIILIILLFIIIFLEINNEIILVEPFQVPEDLAKTGLTGRVVANKLIDKLNYIGEITKTSMEARDFSAEWSQHSLEIEMPGTAISLKPLVEYLKQLIGRRTNRLSGEVIRGKSQIAITIRISGEREETYLGHLENLDSLVMQSAQYTFRLTQPFILASYFHVTDRDKCLDMIRHCIQNDPIKDDYWAYNLWGVLLKDQKKYEEAVIKFKKTIELNSKYAHPHGNLGAILYYQKRYDEAISRFKTVIELDPKSAQAYNNWGIILNEKHEYKKAITKFKKASELNPKYAHVYNNWGLSLKGLKRYNKAVAKFKTAIDLDPKLTQAYHSWGITLNGQQAYKKAIIKFKKAIELNPKYAHAYHNWGLSLYGLKEYNEAISRLKRAIEVDPKVPQYYYNCGIILYEQKEYEESIPMFKKAIELNPKNVQAYNNSGLALYALEKYDAATNKFRKATELNPLFTEGYYNWGLVLQAQRKYEDAFYKFQQVVELDPEGSLRLKANEFINDLKKTKKMTVK